jgi:hypothetical protein
MRKILSIADMLSHTGRKIMEAKFDRAAWMFLTDDNVSSKCSSLERLAFLYRCAGSKQADIAKYLDVNPKSVDNSVRRAKRKLEDELLTWEHTDQDLKDYLHGQV